MSDPKLQEQNVQSAQQAAEYKGESKEKKDIASLLSKFGGFLAVKSFIPAAEDLNPAKKAARNIFLTESRYKDKRENLAKELEGWIELLDSGKTTASEYVDACKEKEAKYQQVLNQGITTALDETHKLETSYRALDSFFKNAGTDRVENLKLINVKKDDIADSDSGFAGEVDQLLKNAFDRLSLKDSYSLLVVPGYVFHDKPTLLKWANIAFKYKVLLITDHADEMSFEDLRDATQDYRDSDQVLQNVVMTANWIVGRESEKLSDEESMHPAFFIPPSAALAGKLYDESANMAQGAGGKKYGTLSEVKGVRNDLLKSEIAALMDNQVVPMVFSEGRVMAFNNTTLYNGDNDAMKEYPIVRVFDWVKKVLMNYVHEVALENWDPYNSPDNLKNKIQDFLNQYQGYGKLFQRYDIKEPKQDPVTKRITVDISLTPYYAAKNFIIKLAADKKTKECETE
ncbi:MAG: type VI secretion system contractile sheath protein TssC [Bacteroidales bacterium]|nr:type VI secretion system contractile sheath protein TssC [Bacteroidales bacterium]